MTFLCWLYFNQSSYCIYDGRYRHMVVLTFLCYLMNIYQADISAFALDIFDETNVKVIAVDFH